MLLIGSCAGKFYAFDKRNGHILWSYDIHRDGNQTSFHGNPLVTDQLILVGTDMSCAAHGIGHIYAFAPETGAVRWKYRTTGVPSDIVRIGDTIVAATFFDELIALSVTDGSFHWHFRTGNANPECDLPASPVGAGDRVFYTGFDGVIYSFEGHSGKILWKRNLAVRATTKLSVINDSIYVGTSDSRLLLLSSRDGQIESELRLPAVARGRILTGGDGFLYLFLEDRAMRRGYLISTDRSLSRIRWNQRTDREWSSEWPRVWNDLLLAGNCQGELHAFRTSDGVPMWSDSLKGCLRSIGTDAHGEQIYIGAQQGTVYAYSPP